MSSELMHGLRKIEDVFHSSLVEFNMCRAELYEEALRNREARLSDSGALIVYTGKHTGRSANDKFIVRDSDTDLIIDWGRLIDTSMKMITLSCVIGFLIILRKCRK